MGDLGRLTGELGVVPVTGIFLFITIHSFIIGAVMKYSMYEHTDLQWNCRREQNSHVH